MTLDYVAPVTFVLVILLSQETFSLKCQTEGCTVRTECRSGLGNMIQINKIHREIESNKQNTEAGFLLRWSTKWLGRQKLSFGRKVRMAG
jgi:NADH:ubiquinone oxidoreductase subunit F (NADH-binding)